MKKNDDWTSGVEDFFINHSHEDKWATFQAANEEQSNVHRILSEWVTDPEGPNFYPINYKSGFAFLMGRPGVGKSHLAWAFFSRIKPLVCEKDGDWPAIWADMPSLMRWLPKAGDYWDYSNLRESNNEYEEPPFARMVLSSWLFLDDLREPANELERKFIIDLFDDRSRESNGSYASGLITTNMNSEALLDFYGARTFDRMNDGALWLPMKSSSMRRPQAFKI